VINDDVAGLSGSLGANHAGARDDLADQGILLLGNVHLNIGLIPVAGPHMKRFRSFFIFALFSTRTRVSEAKGVDAHGLASRKSRSPAPGRVGPEGPVTAAPS